jgi:hypothetical protein
MFDGRINIKNTLYTLTVTENKRQIIRYNKGVFNKTKPFKINE